MKLLFLRGRVPQDRSPKEIMWESLHENPDLWENLACELADTVEILYWGGRRHVKYESTKWVKWIKSLKNYKPDFEPNVIFARGGFEEYHPILRAFPGAVRIYYGAGARYLPLQGFCDYDVTLQDSPIRFSKAAQAFPAINHIHWIKPAADRFFAPESVSKEFDIAYVANGGQARIKRIPWVYKTAPEDLSILHLGLRSNYTAPSHITRKRVKKEFMAKQLNRCKIGIVPYKDTDSAPRAIPEMLACGLPVVAMDSCHINPKTFYEEGKFYGRIVRKEMFWIVVKELLEWVNRAKYDNPHGVVSDFYKRKISLNVCAAKLRQIIGQVKK